jgi:hypothetical protein
MADREQNDSKEGWNMTIGFPLIVAEYSALREDIQKRREIEYQLITLALIASGTIVTIGLQSRNASIMLVYPILALFLSASFLLQELGIIESSRYIQERIESKVGEDFIGFYHFFGMGSTGLLRVANFLARAIFVGTQLLSVLAGISVAKFNIAEIVLLIVAILSIIFTIFLLSAKSFILKRSFVVKAETLPT